jgi:elongator complex protein 1
VLVILKLTPLRIANVPPPMAFHSLALESKTVDVALSKSGTRLAVLSHHDVSVYALDLNKRPVPKPVLLWKSDAIKDHCPRHVTFIDDDQVFVLTDSWEDDESFLWRSQGDVLLPQGPIMEADSASTLLSSIDHESLYTVLQNGSLHEINTDEVTADLPPETSLVNKFPSFAPEVQVVGFEGQVRKLSTIAPQQWLIFTEISLWIDQRWSLVRE